MHHSTETALVKETDDILTYFVLVLLDLTYLVLDYSPITRGHELALNHHERRFTILLMNCCNSYPAWYKRNHRFRHLVYICTWLSGANILDIWAQSVRGWSVAELWLPLSYLSL